MEGQMNEWIGDAWKTDATQKLVITFGNWNSLEDYPLLSPILLYYLHHINLCLVTL